VLANILTFAVLATILVLIPGLDFALVLRYATTQSRKSAILVMLGITSGLFVWGACASLGISAILTASKTAFNVLKIAGVLYMFWIGTSFIVSSFKSKESPEPAIKEIGGTRVFTRGLLSNLLNPKAGVFYLSVLPQFIPAKSNHLFFGLALTGIHALITIMYFMALIIFINTLKGFFEKPRIAANMERISGVAIIGFGAKLFMSHSQ
jgi:threonine/homoserine/homoserine lactone efflux protein